MQGYLTTAQSNAATRKERDLPASRCSDHCQPEDKNKRMSSTSTVGGQIGTVDVNNICEKGNHEPSGTTRGTQVTAHKGGRVTRIYGQELCNTCGRGDLERTMCQAEIDRKAAVAAKAEAELRARREREAAEKRYAAALRGEASQSDLRRLESDGYLIAGGA